MGATTDQCIGYGAPILLLLSRTCAGASGVLLLLYTVLFSACVLCFGVLCGGCAYAYAGCAGAESLFARVRFLRIRASLGRELELEARVTAAAQCPSKSKVLRTSTCAHENNSLYIYVFFRDVRGLAFRFGVILCLWCAFLVYQLYLSTLLCL